MFERFFQWTLRHGPRLLVGAAAAILLVGLAQAINAISMSSRGRAMTYFGRLWEGLSIDWTSSLSYLFQGLSGAALPFFCALVIQRADLWLMRGGAIAAMAPAPAPGWFARHGARVLVALSLPYFFAAALGLFETVLQAVTLHVMVFFQGVWLAPLAEGSLLLFASLALDRLDRWLATVRPCSD
jgi:hypothetical protein